MADTAITHPPLTGLQVLVTRPAHQSEHLAGLIEREGGSAIRFPAIKILDPEDTAALARIIDRLDEFAIAIFVSVNAANKALTLIRARRGGLPPGLVAACVGHGSAQALRHFGIDDPIVPRGRFDSERLLALALLRDVRGKKIVIFRGDGGRELLGRQLTERGAQIQYAECYRRVRPCADVAPLLREWARGAIHITCVTSVAALRNLHDMVGKPGQKWLVETPIVVVSERIARTCRELGFKSAPILSTEASDEGIVCAIKAWRKAQNSL